eukprot:scaffold5135_cov63-Phaeocystis_antarctica.AAC.2
MSPQVLVVGVADLQQAARIIGTASSPNCHTLHTNQFAKRTKGKGAVDRTNYGLTRRSTRSFEMHYKQRISLAAVMPDAKAIRRRLLALKQQLFITAPAASAFNGSA